MWISYKLFRAIHSLQEQSLQYRKKKAEQPDDAIYILRDHTSSFRECFLSDFKSGRLDTYIHAIATQLLILFFCLNWQFQIRTTQSQSSTMGRYIFWICIQFHKTFSILQYHNMNWRYIVKIRALNNKSANTVERLRYCCQLQPLSILWMTGINNILATFP